MNPTRLTGFASRQALYGWLLAGAMLPCIIRAQSNPTHDPQRPNLRPFNPHAKNIWVEDIGSGFHADVQSTGLSLGGYYGFAKGGSQEAHDMTLINFSYSHMLGPVRGADHWYRGNWEFRIQLFGGAQFNPDVDWIVGLTPHLRYTFAMGTRWIPFVDFGAGITGTGIRAPDLGSSFQFNEQAGVGIHWFMTSNIAITFETLYMHISNAGISEPNCGVNGVKGLIGLTYFF